MEGWCTDRGALATWNLGRESINQTKPDVFIDTDVALMTCAFHPEHPVSSSEMVSMRSLAGHVRSDTRTRAHTHTHMHTHTHTHTHTHLQTRLHGLCTRWDAP